MRNADQDCSDEKRFFAWSGRVCVTPSRSRLALCKAPRGPTELCFLPASVCPGFWKKSAGMRADGRSPHKFATNADTILVICPLKLNQPCVDRRASTASTIRLQSFAILRTLLVVLGTINN